MSYPLCSTGRVKTTTNLNHNIWNNNGTWWAHYTVHHDDYTKQRVRVSLGTDDVEIARALRDFIMQATPQVASRIPRSRGQAMPDLVPRFGHGRPVAKTRNYAPTAALAAS